MDALAGTKRLKISFHALWDGPTLRLKPLPMHAGAIVIVRYSRLFLSMSSMARSLGPRIADVPETSCRCCGVSM